MTSDRQHARQVLDAAMSEADLLAAVVELATLRGWEVHHETDSRRTHPGWPDLAMVRGCRFVVAECKTQSEKPTAEQQVWLDKLDAVPAIEVNLWRPANWSSGEIERCLS